MESALQDLKTALRGLLRARGILWPAVVCLALGIGANAVFLTYLDLLFFRPPARVRAAGSVVRLYFQEASGTPQSPASYPMYADLLGRVAALSDLAAYFPYDGSLGRGEEAQRARIGLVTSSFFPLLGVTPWRGRLFSPAEGDPRRPAPVALLSFDLWQRAFGTDPGVIGRQVTIGKESLTVVGILPPGFSGLDLEPVDLWLPLGAVDPGWLGPQWPRKRFDFFLNLIGRLRPGASRRAAAEQASAIHRQVYAALGDRQAAGRAVTLGPIQPGFHPERREQARLAAGLAGTSGMVFLIACANVANLLLVRGLERRREWGLRLAVGASRFQLARLQLLESLGLALLGGAAAAVVAKLGGALLPVLLSPAGATAPGLLGGLDLRRLAILAGSSLAAGLLAGLAPALWGRRQDLASGWQKEAHGGNRGRARLRGALLVFQMALTFVLLAGAGLFLKSLQQVRALPLGFVPDRLLLATADLRGAGSSPAEVDALYRQALARVRQLPGVARAGLAAGIPFRSSFGTMLWVPGRGDIDSGVAPGGLYYNAVSDDFLAALGTSLRRGRAFSAQDDHPGAEKVALVNETMARLLWPGVDALGQCFKIGGDSGPCITVVGIVEDSRRSQLQEAATVQLYLPLAQAPDLTSRALFVRTAGDPEPLIRAIGAAFRETAPRLPFVDVRPVSELLAPHLRPFRLGTTVFTLFGLLALILASVGVAAAVAHAVSVRAREMGIRLTLGAQPRSLLRSILAGSLGVAALALALGLAVVAWTGRFLAPLLFAVEVRDPGILVAAALVLLGATLLASALPGARLRHLDPAAILRSE